MTSRKTAQKKRSKRGPDFSGPSNVIRVADAALRTPVAAEPAETQKWIEDLALFANAFLVNDPTRPGARELQRVRRFAYKALGAIQSNDAQTAAWASMRLLQAAWLAQMLDGERIIRAGASGFEQKKCAAKSAAVLRHDAAADRRYLARRLAAQSRVSNKGIGAVARSVKAAAARIKPATDASTALAACGQRAVENMIRDDIAKTRKTPPISS